MTQFDIKLKNGIASFNTDNFIWQAYAKDDLDYESNLTDDQWLNFVKEHGIDFAEAVGDIAHDLFSLYCEKCFEVKK